MRKKHIFNCLFKKNKNQLQFQKIQTEKQIIGFFIILAAILDAILDYKKRTITRHVHPKFSDTSDIYLKNDI